MPAVRDSWGSRLAIIMAVAGSAIGRGNFLRFPAKAAANGGGWLNWLGAVSAD